MSLRSQPRLATHAKQYQNLLTFAVNSTIMMQRIAFDCVFTLSKSDFKTATMKLFSISIAIFTLAFSTPLSAQTPCVNGMAAGYPCSNVDFLSFTAGSVLGGGDMNDIWGWTDPVYGTEYVLLGRTSGTAFVDISDPVNPLYLGNLPSAGSSSLWRDIKVDGNYAYIVSEASGHGMQIFDLTKLRNVVNPPVTFTEDALYSGWGNAHNIVINEASDRAYGVGTNTSSGGLHIVDISDPLNPVIMGDFAGDGYTHDAQVVNYIGPDAAYAGNEIAFACNENSITVIDVTDPTDAVQLSRTTYNSQYAHQGWLTEDHKYFLSGDELDESNTGVNTTTFIWDVQDLDAPFLLGTFVSTTPAIDHNLYIKDNLCYQSNYRAGLRIASLDNIASGLMTEVGFFDVYPSGDGAGFNGTWSNYPYFASGVIAVSHIEEGLFLLSLSGSISDLGCTDPNACNYDPDAIEDNGLCAEDDVCGICGGNGSSCSGCTDSVACNYDPSATIDDGSCIIGGTGIVVTVGGGTWDQEISWAIVQDDGEIIADGTTGSLDICVGNGCYTFAMNDSYGDGWNGAIYTITSTVSGEVIDSGDLNTAASGDGSSYGENIFCIESGEPDVPGCTNATACNYEATANIDDGSCEYESCVCQGDVNGDGAITVADILLILSDFGCTTSCSADVDGDGSVTVGDVLALLSLFGQAC